MEDMSGNAKKGTTTVGLVCKDGVVMATEHRATMGTLIAHKVAKKLFKIDDNIGLAIAGLVGDAQVLVRYITAEVQLYKLKQKVPMSIKASATLMANILSARRMFPYWVALIIGGVDPEGPHVYSLDAVGGSIPDNYVTTGSGSPMVFGVLEDHYKKGLSIDEGADLVIRSLTAAMKRDSASGNGIDVAIITEEGYRTLKDEEIEERKKKMKLT